MRRKLLREHFFGEFLARTLGNGDDSEVKRGFAGGRYGASLLAAKAEQRRESEIQKCLEFSTAATGILNIENAREFLAKIEEERDFAKGLLGRILVRGQAVK